MADMIEAKNYGFQGTSVTTVLRDSNVPVSSFVTTKYGESECAILKFIVIHFFIMHVCRNYTCNTL